MFKYYILFIVLNTLDLVGSYLLLDPDKELNPVCTYIWENHGFASVIVLKILLIIYPIVIFNYYHSIQPKRAKYVMILANVLVLLPVILLGYLWSLL